MKTITIDKADGLSYRKITVEQYTKAEDFTDETFLKVQDTSSGREIQTNLTLFTSDALPKLISALAGENATVVTDLPEVTVSENGLYVAARDVHRRIEYYTAESFLEVAKNYLALHAFMVKRNEEQEAAKIAEAEAVKAKEVVNAKRRDELAKEFGGGTYASRTARNAIDRIIELEEAAKAPAWT